MRDGATPSSSGLSIVDWSMLKKPGCSELNCDRVPGFERCAIPRIETSKMRQLLDYHNLGVAPLPVRVTTRIITFLVGNPYKASFATVTGWGVDPNYHNVYGNFKLHLFFALTSFVFFYCQV